MVDPWKTQATGWMVVVVGWCISPVISFYLQKLFAYLIFDPPKELRELEFHTVPALKETLRNVEEQRMVRAARDQGSRSDQKTLAEMDVELKYALYQAEDILDLFDYHRIEKKVSGDGGSWGVQQLIHAASSSIFARCCRASWAPLQRLLHDGGACVACWTGILTQQCKDITPAPLLQFVQSMKQQLGRFFEGTICQWRSGALLPVSRAASTVGVQRLYSWCRQRVANVNSCCQSLLSWCTDGIAVARYYRDWSYEQVGIKSNQEEDGNVPIKDKIRVRNQIKAIEDILTSSKKSDLLNNKNSSNGTTKENDKGSSSCCRTTTKDDDKESCSNYRAKESSSTQKEIDDLYRNIEHKVFGREDDLDKISSMLRDEPDADAASTSTNKSYSVIGIYGITGSGKTTLAQYVCKHEKKQGTRRFDPIMFIHVGKTFSMDDIFRDMLEQISQSRPPNDDGLGILKRKLQEELKNKRFLLVLDDLWVNDDNQTKRAILLDALNNTAALSGSRVLVTAQKTDAAQALGAEEQYAIPDLEESPYLSLFMHHARPDDAEYERIGRKIANRLCRSPIAAVTVGKQLQRNKSISFWQATASLDVLNKTMGALWWSYQQLGDDIRRCFAYCSTFPKGYRLKQDELVRIWIAQGFVSTSCNATEEPEDIGQSYIHQLLTFSFLQTQGKVSSVTGDTEEFTIHDLLHELAEKVSGSEFFRIGVNGSPEDIPRRVHHLFVETKNVAEIIEKILDLGNLRTLIINEDSYDSDSKITKEVERNHDLERLLERLFMRLKKLRVLIIKVNSFTVEFSVPASIDHIKHLRYLAFPSRVLRLILPSTFSKLYHIQTIDIPCCRPSCPEDMANLVHLRHISGPLYFPNIGRLTSLQTLEWFEVKAEQGYELNQLKHLNKLRGNLSIKGLGNVKRKEEALEANLAQKEGLRELELYFKFPEMVPLDFSWAEGNPEVVAEVLEGLCPPMHLEKLSIWRYNGSRYPSWMLSRHYSETALKHLRKLELLHCSQLASIPDLIGLCELDIILCDWDRLPQNMERLVSLQTLKIWSCKKMKLLPTLPHQSLKKIEIYNCDELSKTCKEEGHENWRKIQHIPLKFIF